MTRPELRVADGMVVGLDYTLRLDDGQEVEASADTEPLEFLQGKGQIIPGLEQALYGMAVGDEKSVVIKPVDGYGEEDPDAYHVVPRDTFPPELELSAGQRVRLRDQSGEILAAYVVENRPDGVLLDFNHPLAGETLHYDVKVSALRQATDDELSHGHVHENNAE
jgi:FKBP-type peptidyl-prolyl cis-trans isomerase SlyD